MLNREGLPVALKTAKGREVLSSEFMWKNNSPVVIVSYCPKPHKNVQLVSTAHGDQLLRWPKMQCGYYK